MATERGEWIRQDYERNTWLIRHTTEGLTHAESLLQLPFKANCLNWVLGHILAGRQIALEALGGAASWEEVWVARYRGGSAPVTDGDDARALDVMLADVARSQGLLDAALGACTAAELERRVGTGQDEQPLWQVLAGRRWHETYHIGQLGTLRQYILAQREPGERRRSEERRRSQFIYTFEAVRPEMLTDPDAWSERDNEIAAAHFAYLQRATAAGTVLLAGRSQDGVGPALVIFEADSEAEARRFMERDPFVANGLMRARLHPYRAALVRGA
jgi:uncharacterized protein YciI